MAINVFNVIAALIKGDKKATAKQKEARVAILRAAEVAHNKAVAKKAAAKCAGGACAPKAKDCDSCGVK